ncbi:MAG: SRPBCC family protein [Caldilineaceae bacterium]
MKLKATICIDAPKERVWQVLADVVGIPLWAKSIEFAHCEGEQTRGIGTVRICQLKGGAILKETWTAWEEGQSFTYRTVNVALMKSATNRWSVEDINGKTLLTSEATVELKGGLFGRLMEPVVRIWSKRLSRESLAALKCLVETGQPFAGKSADLSVVAATC